MPPHEPLLPPVADAGRGPKVMTNVMPNAHSTASHQTAQSGSRVVEASVPPLRPQLSSQGRPEDGHGVHT